MRRFGGVFCFLMAAAAQACASAAPRSKPQSLAQDGTYRFEERVDGGTEIRGEFMIAGDTITVDASVGPCVYDAHSVGGLSLVYRCADVTFLFDRRDPIRYSSYQTLVTVMETKQVCARYRTNAAGQQVCAEYRTEREPHSVTRTGRLNALRIEGRDH